MLEKVWLGWKDYSALKGLTPSGPSLRALKRPTTRPHLHEHRL